MTGADWLAATGLLRVNEGVLPRVAPDAWRQGMRRVLAFTGGHLRFIGATSMPGGLFC